MPTSGINPKADKLVSYKTKLDNALGSMISVVDAEIQRLTDKSKLFHGIQIGRLQTFLDSARQYQTTLNAIQFQSKIQVDKQQLSDIYTGVLERGPTALIDKIDSSFFHRKSPVKQQLLEIIDEHGLKGALDELQKPEAEDSFQRELSSRMMGPGSYPGS